MNLSIDTEKKQTRRELYALRSVSQSNSLKGHRVQSCQKVPSFGVQAGVAQMGISLNETGKAFFHGVGACGDVHVCPVCREKAGLTRAEEIKTILAHNRASGGIAILVTLTVRHSLETPLKQLVNGLSEAKRRFSSNHATKKIRQIIGYRNVISGRDLTYGHANGWHPHYHDVWLLSSDCFAPGYVQTLSLPLLKFLSKNKGMTNPDGSISLEGIKQHLSTVWAACCVKSGLQEPSITRGLDIQWRDGDGVEAVGSYVAKWAYELSCAHKKQSNSADSMTAFDILRKLKERFDYRLAKLWQEYADAYFGKSLVYFGRGLKAEAGIVELTDEELAERPEPQHHCDITVDEHKAIVYYNCFGDVLDIAQKFSGAITKAYIASVLESYQAADRNYKDYLRNLRASIERDTLAHLEALKVA